MLVECSANNPTDRLTTLSRFEHNLLFLSSAVISRYILNMHIFFDIFFLSRITSLLHTLYTFHKNPIFPSIRTIGGSTNLNGNLDEEENQKRGKKASSFFISSLQPRDNVSLSVEVSRFSSFDFPKSFFFLFFAVASKRGPLINYSPGRKTSGAGVPRRGVFPFVRGESRENLVRNGGRRWEGRGKWSSR